MGKVFSWDEIMENKIPKILDFPIVVNKIKHTLETSEGVIGGTFFGSITENNYSCRSDIDCIIIYDPLKKYEVIDTLQKINRFANDFCIPVELIPLDLSIIKTTLRPLGYLFVVQLQCAVEKGWSIKKSPFLF